MNQIRFVSGMGAVLLDMDLTTDRIFFNRLFLIGSFVVTWSVTAAFKPSDGFSCFALRWRRRKDTRPTHMVSSRG
jgi:hypothetical protein